LKFDKARYAPFFLNPDLLKKVYKGYSYESKGIRNYGLGIRITEFEKGEPFYYHNGWWHGNTSCFINLRKKPVKNKDLWVALLEAEKRHSVRWHWVKGHSGHPENERADELANQAIDRDFLDS
jgi:hypothetical protein